MPQMAPINWMSSYFLFIMIFIMFIMLNYFSFMYPYKSVKPLKHKTIIYWKW